MDKKLQRDKQKLMEDLKEKKEQEKELGLRVHQEDHKSNIKFMKYILNDNVVYDLKSIHKKGKNVIGFKDSLTYPCSSRILRGEDYILDAGGDCFLNWMKAALIDIKGRGFGCRIEKLDEKLSHKTLFMGNLYPKGETYILKIGMINSKSSLGFKKD